MMLRTGLLVKISGYHHGRDHLQWQDRSEKAFNRVATRVEEQLITLQLKIQPRKCNSDGFIR